MSWGGGRAAAVVCGGMAGGVIFFQTTLAAITPATFLIPWDLESAKTVILSHNVPEPQDPERLTHKNRSLGSSRT